MFKFIKEILKENKPKDIQVSQGGLETATQNYKVAGVTFNNDDGENRQVIISKLKVGSPLKFVIC